MKMTGFKKYCILLFAFVLAGCAGAMIKKVQNNPMFFFSSLQAANKISLHSNPKVGDQSTYKYTLTGCLHTSPYCRCKSPATRKITGKEGGLWIVKIEGELKSPDYLTGEYSTEYHVDSEGNVKKAFLFYKEEGKDLKKEMAIGLHGEIVILGNPKKEKIDFASDEVLKKKLGEIGEVTDGNKVVIKTPAGSFETTPWIIRAKVERSHVRESWMEAPKRVQYSYQRYYVFFESPKAAFNLVKRIMWDSSSPDLEGKILETLEITK
jgi:hypothetical protein